MQEETDRAAGGLDLSIDRICRGRGRAHTFSDLYIYTNQSTRFVYPAICIYIQIELRFVYIYKSACSVTEQGYVRLQSRFFGVSLAPWRFILLRIVAEGTIR